MRPFEQGSPFAAPIELCLYGSDVTRLQQLSEQVRAVVAGLPAVTQVRTRLTEVLTQLALAVDEPEARSRGLSQREIAQQLATLTEGSQGGTILEDTQELPVRVRLTNPVRENLAHTTTFTTMAGFLPLILAGGGFWPPMAVVIAGGWGELRCWLCTSSPACRQSRSVQHLAIPVQGGL